MHAVILDDLEQYLSGDLTPSALSRFQSHLANCGECRQEVEEIQESTGLFEPIKPAGEVEPPPYFLAKVMESFAGLPAPSFWNSLGDWAFVRQVVFAALVMLAVLGTVLVSREESYAPNPPTPQAVMAEASGSPNADQMLVTLANYEP